jgi:hypothetical protein
MAKKLAEGVSIESALCYKLLRVMACIAQMLRQAQAPPHHLQSDRQAATGALNKIGSASGDE